MAEESGSEDDFASMILTSGRRLESMLVSVLELARLEANDVQLSPTSIRVSQEVDEVVESFHPRARAKGLDLQVIHRSRDDEPLVVMDRDSVRQILRHLLDNAVKFTHAGRVTIVVHGDETGVNVQVKDTGIGMDDSFLPELYAPFKQASEGLARGYEGSGLGLTIVSRLIDLLDADMSIDSVVDEGTTVTLYLRRSIRPRNLRRKASE